MLRWVHIERYSVNRASASPRFSRGERIEEIAERREVGGGEGAGEEDFSRRILREGQPMPPQRRKAQLG